MIFASITSPAITMSAMRAEKILDKQQIIDMPGPFGLFGGLYQVGHFVKRLW